MRADSRIVHGVQLAAEGGAQVVVGTPGRVIDHRRGTLDLSRSLDFLCS